MAVIVTSPVVVSDEFLSVILADPDLYAAFVAIVELWNEEPPAAPPSTKVAAGYSRNNETASPEVTDQPASWKTPLLRGVLRPHVARSPPEHV